MNIAQIGPFYEAVSLHSEGPEGRMIASLSEGLLRLRHDVTVFASGDSHTVGRVIPVAPLAMRAYPMPKRHLADALAMLALEKAFAMAPTFDMIRVDPGGRAVPLMRRSPIPIVGTIYGPIDAPLDYSQCGPQGEPSVVYIDEDRSVKPVAPTFAAFLGALQECSLFP